MTAGGKCYGRPEISAKIETLPGHSGWFVEHDPVLEGGRLSVANTSRVDQIPDDRRLDAETSARGGSLSISHDPQAAYRGADVIYAKSWGAIPYFGRWDQEKPIRDAHKHFIVDEAKMALTNNGMFSHCLPLRRNVKATDGVMDSKACIAIDEAENRLHVQKAVMVSLVGSGIGNGESRMV